MRKNLKKALSVLMVVLIMLTSAPLQGFVDMDWSWLSLTADAASYEGTCGTDLTWVFDDETGILTVSGTGSMKNYTVIGSTVLSQPWKRYKSAITEVVISDGVTSIGNAAFAFLICLEKVTIPESVTSMGKNAFLGCSSLESIAVPNAEVTLDSYAFGYDSSKTLYSFTSIYGVVGGEVQTYATGIMPFYCIHCYENSDNIIETNNDESITCGDRIEYSCADCGATWYSSLPIAHEFVLSNSVCTCTDGGVDTYTCTKCGQSYTVEFAARHADADNDGFCDYCAEPFGGVLDLVFVIDSTGSMGDEISVVKESIQTYADMLSQSNIPHYIALVDYSKDSSNNGLYNYYNVNFDFTNDETVIAEGIANLTTKGGSVEPAYSALINGLDELHWGVNSTRRIILIGDEEPWSNETNTGYTYDTALESLQTNDISVYSIATGGSDVSSFKTLAQSTNGQYYQSSDSEEFAATLTDIIDSIPESIHIHEYAETVITAVTCLTDGLSSYKCVGCGRQLENVTVSALGHDYVSQRVDATDEMEEHTCYTCSRCDDSYIVLDPASPVEGLQAFAGTYTVSLSWLKAVEASVTGYNIYRKLADDAAYELIKTVNSRSTTSYVDENLLSGYEYMYYITALKDDVEGLQCDAVTCIPKTDEEEPRVLKFETSESLNDVIAGTVKFTAKAEDNIGVVRFEMYCLGENSDEWKLIAEYEGASAVISFDTSSLDDGKYSFKAVAYDAKGNSGDGNIVKTYTVDNTGPEKVTGLTAKAIYASKATIAWNNVSDEDINHFILRRKTDSGYEIVSDSVTGVLGYNFESLSPETQYTYSVAGVDHYGNIGEYSDDFSFTTAADTTAPVITALSPSSGRYNSSISFKATAKDDCAVSSITVQTSLNGTDWEDIRTVTYSDNAASKTFSYTVSLAEYNDGTVYIRAIAEDCSGNVSDTGETAPFIQYYVDKTAPAAPTGVTAVGGDGYIQIKWNASSETDLGGYYVYRSTSENGTFTLLSNKLSTLNYYDRNVTRDTTYYYKVEATDTVGNVSEKSETVSAQSLTDTVAPTVQSISPSSGTAVSANNNKIGILANDNNMLDKIVAEYKYGDSYVTLATFSSINAASKVVYTSLPVDEFENGDVVYVRAYCTDTAGYTSAYSSEIKYVIDKVAPGLSGLTYELEDGTCTLKWNDLNDTDLSGFKVYRSVDGGSYKLLGSRSAASSHTYTFSDTVSVGTYIYKVESIDKSGNSAAYYSQSITLTESAQLNPVITGESYIEQGVQEVFSASASTADNGIVSYSWNFGDGSTSDKINVIKSYSETGTYTVTLTITDGEGNSASVSKTVTVTARELLGTASVKVVDDNGYVISNAPVYFDLGEENQQIVYTNTSGYASLTMTAGTHVVGSYKNGYLPTSANITVLANSTVQTTLTMIEQELITGEFEVHEMTFEEIVAAGIDVNDPANQQIYEVTVTLIYGEEKVPVSYVRNDTEIISYTVGNTGGTSGGSIGGGKISGISYIPNDMNQEIIAVVAIPITASYLKQFYSANLYIVNNAAPGYEIVNCEATINVPEGLTVVQYTPIASVIDGQQSSCANWILRGDKEGTYNLSAHFSGVLDSFNVPVSAYFTADDPVYVYGPDSVKLRIEVQEEINEKLFYNVCLVNNRSVNVNRPRINVSDFIYNITEYYKKNLTSNGISVEDVELIQNTFLRMGVISADGTATFYDVSDPEDNPVDVLGPGETLVYEYCVNKVTDYAGTGYFNKAIVECDDYYASSIEVVTMGSMPVVITEDQFVKEHNEFIASDMWKYADTKFPERLSEALKDEWEDDWYEFIEFDYFTNYADIVLADYLLQESTYNSIEIKYEKLIRDALNTGYEKVSSLLWDNIWDLTVVKESDLTQDKIYKILTGQHYESADYKTFEFALGWLPDGVLKGVFNTLYVADVGLSIYEFYGDSVEKIRSAINYGSALEAYKKCTDEQFKTIFESAVNYLGEDEKKMRNAMEDFLSYDNSSEFGAKIKQAVNGLKCGAIVVADGTIRSWLFIFKDMYLARIKVFASAALQNLSPYFSAGSDFTVASVTNGLCLGYRLGVVVSKLLANTGNLNLVLSQLEYYTQLASALEGEMRNREAAFKNSGTYEDAMYFCTSFDSFKTAWLATAELFAQFAVSKNDALFVKIFNKDKFKDNITDAVNDVTYIKQLYCHNVNHFVAANSSKTVVVECPVDVCVYSSTGELLAKVTDTETVINDQSVFALSYDGKKIVSVPSTDEYSIQITAYDSGEMDYTVLEYSSDVNIRRVVFEDIALETNDVFEGSIDSVIFTDKDNYALTKNNETEILPSADTVYEVTGITLDNETVTAQLGGTVKLNATVEPSDVENDTVVWSSLDETVATVDENGVVSALTPGEVVIKAVSSDGGYVAYCSVTVECTEHVDKNGDNMCDYGCGYEFDKTAADDSAKNCSHLCHSNNAFVNFIWRILKFLFRIFNVQQYCDCGAKHY